MDIFPEILNTKEDTLRDIEASEEEGICETTHMILDYKKQAKYVSIEFNQHGAKLGDIVEYLQSVGVAKGVITEIGFRPIIKDDLKSFQTRINRCSEKVMRVHKQYH